MASLTECFGKWKVVFAPRFKARLERDYPEELVDRLLGVVRELEEDLNTDPQSIFRLLREPIVIREAKVRRLRMGKYRVWFIVTVEDCQVLILGLEHREGAYERLRKRR